MSLHVLSRIGFFLTASSLLSTPGAKSTSGPDFTARNKSTHFVSLWYFTICRDLHKMQTVLIVMKIEGWLTEDKYSR